MRVSPVVVPDRSCPICGTPRIGAFRYCRACGLDYDQNPPVSSGPADQPEERATQPVARQVVATAPYEWSGPTAAVPSGGRQPVAVGPGRPVAAAPTPTPGGRARRLPGPRDLGFAIAPKVLLGIAIGSLAGLGVVLVMVLLTGHA